jgi:hypothetical protein
MELDPANEIGDRRFEFDIDLLKAVFHEDIYGSDDCVLGS